MSETPIIKEIPLLVPNPDAHKALSANPPKKVLNPYAIKDQQARTLQGIKINSPLWWETMQSWLSSTENNDYKKLAFTEFNKLQIKLLPSDMKIGLDPSEAIGMIILPQRQAVSAPELPDKEKKTPITIDN